MGTMSLCSVLYSGRISGCFTGQKSRQDFCRVVNLVDREHSVLNELEA